MEQTPTLLTAPKGQRRLRLWPVTELRTHPARLDEHSRIAGRTTCYETLDKMPQDLDNYLDP